MWGSYYFLAINQQVARPSRVNHKGFQHTVENFQLMYTKLLAYVFVQDPFKVRIISSQKKPNANKINCRLAELAKSWLLLDVDQLINETSTEWIEFICWMIIELTVFCSRTVQVDGSAPPFSRVPTMILHTYSGQRWARTINNISKPLCSHWNC